MGTSTFDVQFVIFSSKFGYLRKTNCGKHITQNIWRENCFYRCFIFQNFAAFWSKAIFQHKKFFVMSKSCRCFYRFYILSLEFISDEKLRVWCLFRIESRQYNCLEKSTRKRSSFHGVNLHKLKFHCSLLLRFSSFSFVALNLKISLAAVGWRLAFCCQDHTLSHYQFSNLIGFYEWYIQLTTSN